MKELTQHLAPKIEQHEVKEIRKQVEHIASMRLYKGQKIFRYNLHDKKVTVVDEKEYEKPISYIQPSVGCMDIEDHAQRQVKGNLKLQKGNLYVTALNEKNAAKKFLKLLCQIYPSKTS